MHLLFLTYLFFLVIRPHEYLPALIGVPVPRFLLLLTLGLWWVQRSKSFRAPQYHLVFLLVMVAAASQVARGWFGGVPPTMMYFIPLFMFFVAAVSESEDPARLKRILMVLCLCAFVLVGHGMDQVFTDGLGWTGVGIDYLREGSDARPRIQYIGVFSDANDLGMLLVGCVPLCAYLAIRAGWMTKLFWYGGVVLLTYGVYLTGSRGGLLGLLAIVCLWLWFRFGTWAVGLLAAIALPTIIGATRLASVSIEEASAAGRLEAWYVGLQMFRSHPLFGTGYDSFEEYHFRTAHSSLFLILAELGLPGYVLWFMATGFSVLMLWTIFRTVDKKVESGQDVADEERNDGRLAAALLLSSLGMLIAALFLSRSYMILIFLVWAWSAGHYTGAQQRIDDLPDIRLGTIGTSLAVVAVGSVAGLFVLVHVLLAVL